MSYQLLNSSDVQVFPFGKKRLNDPNARVLNEQNITNLVRMLTDRKNYVVSYDDSDGKLIEFVINGYLFKADVSDLWNEFSKHNAVYAYIDLATTGDNYSYLKGGDNVSVILNGTGTSEAPYELSDGAFTTVIQRPQGDLTDQDTYFQYKFKIPGELTIYDNNNIKISNLAEGSYRVEGNKIIVSGGQDSEVKFCISLEQSANYGDIRIDCPNAGKFTGITFVFERPQDGFYLKLFELTRSGISVAQESFVRFDWSSISSELEIPDNIIDDHISAALENYYTKTETDELLQELEFNCGTAAEFI